MSVEIVDVCAWTGHWASLRLAGEAERVVASLEEVGVGSVLLSPLDAAFAHNPHLANADVYEAAERFAAVRPVPVLDPGLATWREELALAAARGAPAVRWLPAYGGYDLKDADDCAAAVGEAGLVLFVQTRLEDVRRQHPRAVVHDVDAAEVADLARRHPRVPVVIGGAAWKAILDLGPRILGLERLYADVSQADGMDSLLRLVAANLTPRLLFGSHAPFFVPLAGLARVVLDLEALEAEAILGGNARRLLPQRD